MQFKSLTLSALVVVLLAAGCSKDEKISEVDRQAMEQASREYVKADKIFDDVFKAVNTQAMQQGSLNGLQSPSEPATTPRDNCPVVTFSNPGNAPFPAVLTLDYGDGCSAGNGPRLSGKIIATFNGLLLRAGTSISITFENFTHEGNAVTGTYRLSNDGEDAAGRPTFTGTVQSTVTTAAGKTFTYQALGVSKQTEGKDTNFFTSGIAGILDDVWSSTREATLSSSDGQVLTVGTPDAIRSELTCIWPVSGALRLSLNNPATNASIDFGAGNCDNKATLTIGDYSVEINL